jgi:hypothetical protein
MTTQNGTDYKFAAPDSHVATSQFVGLWAGSGFDRTLVQIDPDDPGDAAEVAICCQHCRLVASGDRRDHAVDQPTGGYTDLTTLSVEGGCCVKVSDCIKREQMKSKQEAAQIVFTFVTPSTCHHLRDHRFRDGQRTFVSDQSRETLIDRASRRSVELHPSRRVDQYHELGGRESAATFPMARAPRMARASSSVIGCPARWRKARSTASVLVRRW